MRWINKIIVHCSDSPYMRDDSAADIDAWHRQRGFRKIGYHYVVRLDGRIEKGREEREVGAHCKTQNLHSIGVCYIGGRDPNGKLADTRTQAQKESLYTLLSSLVEKYHCPVFGHRDFSRKPCPCFDAKAEYADLYEQIKGK